MVTLKKVTIVAEAVLEARLLRELKGLGARGYTLTEVRGEGSRGVRASDLGAGNIQIDVLVGEEVCEKILAHVAERYFRHYAVVAWVTEVGVVRGDKYV